ncbi:hypothetical protein FisN_13Hh337 [Fistulifera solaris]|uniref:Complex 1 LYR protein domain-containing protein n=1 Tax=Fistulifera solaris TaxID=1519565 RepID=A0A1Z5KMR6_FISSO|nr:hypothetical protein FisN_13Hh337 [Fistulifera solaris]|eukprot:GAX27576.1 hypothetical protein FisN_13Hh337 [Fistulifera solaris]
MSLPGFQRTSLQLYRDCLRLIQHVAPGRSAKNTALRQTVRQQFARNRDLTDEEAIQNAQTNAVRALSNYLLAAQASTDKKVGSAMKDYTMRSMKEAKSIKHDVNKKDS